MLPNAGLLRGSFSLILMKTNFDQEDEERRARWGTNGFDLEVGKGRRGPQGLSFLKRCL